MSGMKNDGNAESGTAIDSARKHNRDRVGLVAALLLVSIAVGAAAKMSREADFGHLDLAAASPSELVSQPDAVLHYSSASTGPITLTAELDRGAVLQGTDGLLNLELTIRADPRMGLDAAAPRMPIDLVMVLDRSGSMAGSALEHAAAAGSELIGALAPEDRFSLVTYSGSARVEVPLAKASDLAKKSWYRVLRSVRAGGGTNMAEGLDLANAEVARLREPGRALRVILLSDGHANEGDHSHAGLRRRAAAAVPGEYVLSALGVGDGFDQQLMVALADAGTGNFYYVSDPAQLAGVFADEFATARETVAQALEVVVDPAPGIEMLDAAGYPLERGENGLVRFRPGTLFAGQERKIWLRFRSETQPLGERTLAGVSLKYVADGESHVLALSTSPRFACVEGEDVFHASIDEDAWARNVATDGLSRVKQVVSQALQRGDVAEARLTIMGFVSEAERENADYENERVNRSVAAAKQMEVELDAAMAIGATAQDRFSKKLSQEGLDGRRRGAKHHP